MHIDGDWTLRDNGSTNGTYVNGLRVVDEMPVRAGDELALGCSRFILAPPRP
jgi:pSer/pThr/pTyr-binding forkhead associated (FHA) protein